jgi:hypothetical protein
MISLRAASTANLIRAYERLNRAGEELEASNPLNIRLIEELKQRGFKPQDGVDTLSKVLRFVEASENFESAEKVVLEEARKYREEAQKLKEQAEIMQAHVADLKKEAERLRAILNKN